MKRYPIHQHGKPVTRRDFLAAGLIQAAGLMMAPSLYEMFLSSKTAAAAGEGPGFAVLDFAGGMAIPRNFMVGGQGGPSDRLPSYFTLGLGTTSGPNIAANTSYGLPMPTTSPFLQGFEQTASAACRAKVRFGSFCHRSIDDTQTNRHSALVLVSQVSSGRNIPTGVGNRPSASGGFTGVPEAVSALRPILLESTASLAAAVTLGGTVDLNASARAAWSKAVRKLVDAQGAKYQDRLGGAEFLERLKASADKNQEQAVATLTLDVRQMPDCQAIFGITPTTAPNDPACIEASIAYAATTRLSGPGCLFRGGYDYHSGGFDDNLSDAELDRNAGRVFGRFVELAHRLSVPVMIQMLTDGGSIFGNTSTGYRPYTDAGDRSLTILGYYDPQGPRAMVRQQVGYYTAGEVSSTRSIIGTDESKVAYGILANYLNVCGRLGEFSRIGGKVISAGETDQLLLFG